MTYKKLFIIFAFLMTAATVTYISFEVYAYHTRDVVYGAYFYTGEPLEWYSPEQLGAVSVEDYGVENATVVWLVVPSGHEPFPLREVQPIFLYKGKFYQVSELCIGYSVPQNLPQQPVGAVVCGLGWLATGILYLKWRGKNEEVKRS